MDNNNSLETSEESENDELLFSSYDIGLSTALLCLGFELLALDKDNPRKALFIFKKDEGIEHASNRYFSDRLEVKARSYFDNLKAFKNKLYGN